MSSKFVLAFLLSALLCIATARNLGGLEGSSAIDGDEKVTTVITDDGGGIGEGSGGRIIGDGIGSGIVVGGIGEGIGGRIIGDGIGSGTVGGGTGEGIGSGIVGEGIGSRIVGDGIGSGVIVDEIP